MLVFGVVLVVNDEPPKTNILDARFRGWWWREILPCRVSGEGGLAVGGNPVQLAFGARDGWWSVETPAVSCFGQGTSGGGRKSLPARISGEGGVVVGVFERGMGGGGQNTPPSRVSEEGGWWRAGNTPVSRFMRGNEG